MNNKVYLIGAEMNGVTVYKIGTTKRKVTERLNDFKTGNISLLFIVNEFNGDIFYNKIEKRLHQHFKSKRIDEKREWFSLNNEDIKEFIPLCDKYLNIYQTLQIDNPFI